MGSVAQWLPLLLGPKRIAGIEVSWHSDPASAGLILMDVYMLVNRKIPHSRLYRTLKCGLQSRQNKQIHRVFRFPGLTDLAADSFWASVARFVKKYTIAC